MSHVPLSQPSSRLHGLDALRGGALLLGVVLHCTMSFLPWSQFFWVTSDVSQSRTMAVLFWVIHLFRMTVFFVLAGFFGRMLCERLGTRAFVGDRARRIGLVLVLAWPLLYAGIVGAVRLSLWMAYGDQPPPFVPPSPKFTPDDFPLAHLWFLYLLLIFYAVMLALRALLARLDRDGRLNRFADRLLRIVLGPWAALLLAIPVAAVLYLQKDWYQWFGVPTPDRSLYPNLSALTAYGLAFVLGWWLQRQPDLLARLARHWPLHLLLAGGCAGWCLYTVGLSPFLLPAVRTTTTLVYAACYGVALWAATLALIGLALRFWSGYSPARRYLVDASYWIYLAHLPLVMALQALLSQQPWHWAVKFALVLVAAMALLLSSYALLVRRSWLGRLLQGGRNRHSSQ